ncbi:hypothetical protein [Microbacterium sp.]|uniref:hypothetical protein n=1 Tax=Microbacterium sp. TaxID=51671 RepID=UPI0039E226D7
MIGSRIDARILFEIASERVAQDDKWGAPKDVPNGTGPDVRARFLSPLSYALLRDRAQETTDGAAVDGESLMSYVLLEEVFEALAEDDDTKLRVELIQVAAVAAKWVRIIDQRTKTSAVTA